MSNRPVQKPKLELRLALIEQRVSDLVSVPSRVTRLEGEFEHMATQLEELTKGQQVLTATVADLGTKVTRMIAILTVLGVAAQIVAPAVLRVLFP